MIAYTVFFWKKEYSHARSTKSVDVYKAILINKTCPSDSSGLGRLLGLLVCVQCSDVPIVSP